MGRPCSCPSLHNPVHNPVHNPPFGSGLSQISSVPVLVDTADELKTVSKSPAFPAYSWLIAMAFGFVKTDVRPSGAPRWSFPASSGDDVMHHMLKWARFASRAASVPSHTNSPTPTSKMSGSFHEPGLP